MSACVRWQRTLYKWPHGVFLYCGKLYAFYTEPPERRGSRLDGEYSGVSVDGITSPLIAPHDPYTPSVPRVSPHTVCVWMFFTKGEE